MIFADSIAVYIQHGRNLGNRSVSKIPRKAIYHTHVTLVLTELIHIIVRWQTHFITHGYQCSLSLTASLPKCLENIISAIHVVFNRYYSNDVVCTVVLSNWWMCFCLGCIIVLVLGLCKLYVKRLIDGGWTITPRTFCVVSKRLCSSSKVMG